MNNILNIIVFLTALWFIGLPIFLLFRKRAIILSSFVLLIPIITMSLPGMISPYLIQPNSYSIVEMVLIALFLLLVLYLIIKYNGKILFGVNIEKFKNEMGEYCETMDYKCKFNNNSIQIDIPNGEIKMNVNKWFNTVQFKNKTCTLLSDNILNILLQNSGKHMLPIYLILTIMGLIVAINKLYSFFI